MLHRYMHTKQVEMYVWIIAAFNELHAGYRSKLTATLKNMDLATKAFQNEFEIYTPAKTRSSHAQFQKGQSTTCKTRCAFSHSPLGYRVLVTNLLHSQALD